MKMVHDTLNSMETERNMKQTEYEVPQFINGKSVTTQGRKLDLYNPATGMVTGQVDVANKQTVDQAVAAAKAAFPAWSATTPPQRAKILFRFKTLLEQNRDQLIKLITQEHGKTISEAQGSL